MRGALYEICAIYRRRSENARRRANDVLVKRPLIRLRHLLPQLKSAGGEGLSIGGTAENEQLAQLHIVPSFVTLSSNRLLHGGQHTAHGPVDRFHGAVVKPVVERFVVHRMDDRGLARRLADPELLQTGIETCA